MIRPPAHLSSTTSLRDRLKAAGIQASAPRMAIASYVWSTCSHPTAEDVKREVEKTFPMVSLATVYNTLNLFVAHGLLIEVRDPRMKSIRYDCKVEPHFHFFDETSGEIYDLEPSQVEVYPRLPRCFQITGMELTLRGRKNSKVLDKTSGTLSKRTHKPHKEK